ncbi:MAG: SGNH hydrolase domain-containing protein [Actinomycetes bacterium]
MLCAQAGRCPVWVDGVWRYYDDRHLTVAGSLLVRDRIDRAVRNLHVSG